MTVGCCWVPSRRGDRDLDLDLLPLLPRDPDRDREREDVRSCTITGGTPIMPVPTIPGIIVPTDMGMPGAIPGVIVGTVMPIPGKKVGAVGAMVG